MAGSTEPKAQATHRLPAELNARHFLERLIGFAALLGIVAAAISSVPGLGTLRSRFAHADALLVCAVAALKLGSALSNIVAFRDVFCRGMGWRFNYQLGMAEQATNVLVPTGGAGGLALGAWALRQGGMSTEHIARRSVAFFVLTSLPNFACAALLGPVLLAGVFAGADPVVPTALFTVLAWVAAAVIALLPMVLRRLGRGGSGHTWRDRLRAGARTLAGGIADTGVLLRTGRWQAILGACGYLAFDIGALIVAFAATGGTPPLGPLIFAYVIGQLGGLIPLPGGIGGTDGGLIGAMVLYGSPLAQATAAVLVYRTFQLGVPAILGTISFIQLRRTLNRAPSPAAACAPLAERHMPVP
jgi:uncharacterized membrane protein YbhN (UPF0104 family)